MQRQFESKNQRSGINILVKEVPQALLTIPHIKDLEIRFMDRIVIPDEMKNIKIDKLKLRGKISEQETERIKAMFPETDLTIVNTGE